MFNKDVIVRCESGLHNKQATYFVQKANEFESSIWLESGSRKMNAKSLLGIMSLGTITGTTVTLSAMGPDAEAAVNALETLLYTAFDETHILDLRHYKEQSLKDYLADYQPDIVLCIQNDTFYYTKGGNNAVWEE